jgi:hypothetical protein
MLGDYFLALDSFDYGSQVIEDCGLDYSSVSQYRWVSSKIPPDLRDPSLPYSYHRAVAALSHEQQLPMPYSLPSRALTGHSSRPW